jgi:hypothetical protein
MAFPAMISMKLTHAQHSVQSCYTKFHPNWTPDVETTHKTPFTAHISIKPTQQHHMEILYFKISVKSVKKYDQFMPLATV